MAVFAKPVPLNLHRFFWRELLIGTRVYEHEDFDKAIELLASGAIPFDQLITDVVPLDRLEDGLKQMESGAEVMKILVECGN
ncbi:MAG: hypothetical protein U0Q16_14920 [Bryobacteraceae bacterium]